MSNKEKKALRKLISAKNTKISINDTDKNIDLGMRQAIKRL